MRTYGTLRYTGDFWAIEAEPHVTIRLKRMFARLSEQAASLRLRHTTEVARDLEWVLERYPLEVDEQSMTFLRAQAQMHTERSARFIRVLSGAEAPQEFDLALPPRDYQRIAAELALHMGGLLIADEMGVGKTVQSICMLTDPRTRPALVVTKTDLPKQWAREIAKFAPRLRTHILKKGTPYPLPHLDVIITNYHKLAGWAPALRGKVASVVFDEVQELRHAESAKAKAAREIAVEAAFRLGLSGTPIHNYGEEFFQILDVLRPGELGTLQEFKREWCTNPDSETGATIKDPKAFGAYVREQALMIRRTRKDVGRELPGLSIVPHVVESDDAFSKVEGDITELARFILDRDAASKGLDQMKARGELDWRLRQATGIAKAPYVAAFVRMLVESGERVLLYGWHHAVYDIWQKKLGDLKLVMFTGEESPAQKERSLEAFKAGTANVMIMSLRAGAGLDGLQHCCRTVVFGELDWSPAVHEQAYCRVFRDGQPDPVMAYFLVSEDGSDPVVQSTLGLKRMQLEGVRDPDLKLLETVKTNGVVDLARAVLAKRKPVQAEMGDA